jgi:hypothetical protein
VTNKTKQFRKEGFLPDAMINYLALLGWNDGSEQEVFSVSCPWRWTHRMCGAWRAPTDSLLPQPFILIHPHNGDDSGRS